MALVVWSTSMSSLAMWLAWATTRLVTMASPSSTTFSHGTPCFLLIFSSLSLTLLYFRSDAKPDGTAFLLPNTIQCQPIAGISEPGPSSLPSPPLNV